MKKTFHQIRSKVISEQRKLIHSNRLVTDADLKKLPAPIQFYLQKTGAVEKPILWNADVHWEETELSLKLGTKARKMTTLQFLSCNPVARLMLMKIHGMPFQGLDSYHKGLGKMNGKLFGLFTVVNAEGKEMNVSELITIFTEFALLNSFFLLENVRFEVLNEQQIKAWFTDCGITVSGVFTFEETGLIIRFETNERYRNIGKGKSILTPFLMTIKSYRRQNDYLLPKEVTISWIVDGKEFEYFSGRIKYVDFNVTK